MKVQTPFATTGLLVLVVPVLLVLPASAHAQDYASSLKTIQDKQNSINVRMTRLGFHVPEAEEKLDGKNAEAGAPHLFRVHDTLSNTLISAGRLLFGRTYFRLVVGSENSPTMLILNDGQGALSELKLLGKARAASTEGRLLIDLDRLVLRSGKVIPVQATVLDDAGAYGLQAQVFSGKVWAALGATASSFISGLAASQESLTPNAFGFSQPQPTGRNSILQGVAQAAADQSKRLMDEATREKPVLVIESETTLSILVNEEVRL